MSNLVSHLQSLNNPILGLQNTSKEFHVLDNKDTNRGVVIDKLNPKVKKGGCFTIADQFGYGKSALLKIESGLKVPHKRKIDHPSVETISRGTVSISGWFFDNDRELGLKHGDKGRIFSEQSPN